MALALKIVLLSSIIFSLFFSVNGDVPVPPTPSFPCVQNFQPKSSDDVTKLQPGNIQAVMAMGDSISAGALLFSVPWETRGLVFSVGGSPYVDDFGFTKALTLPNFLLTYNPKLQGQTYDPTLLFTPGSNLDAAVSAARVDDLPAQVDYLVEKLHSQYNSTIDFYSDWKLLTILIGANDLCEVCKNDTHSTPEYFEKKMREIISDVRDKIPRVFVNLIGIFNISGVWTSGNRHEYCKLLWEGPLYLECDCLFDYDDNARKLMDENSMLYNQAMERIAADFSSQNTGDKNFTVVYQPGISGFNISYLGAPYLSGLDCFHPSVPGDEGFAIAIWNNMFSPSGKKQVSVDPYNIFFLCPDENTFLQ